jgi:hypothetical protein
LQDGKSLTPFEGETDYYADAGGNITPLSLAAPAAVVVMATMLSRSITAVTSTHFYRSVIRASNEFESQMSHLFASLPARIGDSGY